MYLGTYGGDEVGNLARIKGVNMWGNGANYIIEDELLRMCEVYEVYIYILYIQTMCITEIDGYSRRTANNSIIAVLYVFICGVDDDALLIRAATPLQGKRHDFLWTTSDPVRAIDLIDAIISNDR